MNTNIAERIFQVARDSPMQFAFQSERASTSYARLRTLAVAHALRLQQNGVNRGSVVAVGLTNLVANICVVLGCALLGSRWVHATKAAINSTFLNITHVIRDQPSRPPTGARALRWDASWTQIPKTQNKFRFPGFAAPSDAWMIAQSSGTTGTVKFIPITASGVLERLAYPFDLDMNERPVGASLSQPLSVISLFAILRILVRGGTILVGRDFAFFAKYGANYITGSPTQLDALCRRYTQNDDKKICSVAVAGGISTPRLYEALFERFEVVRNVYSSSEAGVASSKLITPATMSDGSAGPAAEAVSIEIVDSNGALMASGEKGLVRLRAPGQSVQYIGDAETTKTAFLDGWFYPGDIGYLSAAGELHVSGRANDQLNFGGIKVNAEAIDEVVQAVAGVVDGICFLQSQFRMVDELAVVICQQPETDTRQIAAEIRKAIAEKFGPSRVPKRIYVSEKVLRNENGKPTRHLAADAVKGLEPIA